MKKHITFILLLACSCSNKSSLIVYDTCVSNVKIVDVISGATSTPVNIYISHGIIKTIVPYNEKEQPKSKQTIDGKGLFVSPGLWDMHAHPDDPELWRMDTITKDRDMLMPQFILNGVFGIRDMAGSLKTIDRWKELGMSNQLLVPRIYAGGPLLDGPNPMWDGSVGIDSPEKASYVADSLITAGVDFLKIYSLLPRDTYFALAEHANSLGFPFAGHVPFTVSPSEAARSGMKSQEHLLEIHKEASHIKDAIKEGKLDLSNYKGLDKYVAFNNYMLENFDTVHFNEMIQTFKQTGTWHCPTLSMWQKNAWFEEERAKDDKYWDLLPGYIQEYWTVGINDHLNNRDSKEFIDMKKKLYNSYLYIVNAFYKAGIPMLTGTDMGANPLCWAGIGVHNEMKEMKKAGMDNLTILQSATINPALYFHLDDSLGSISIGKKVELVFTRKNPLKQIDAYDSIEGLYFNHTWIDSKRRNELFNTIIEELKK